MMIIMGITILDFRDCVAKYIINDLHANQAFLEPPALIDGILRYVEPLQCG
jgi:hypothetical protein